MFYKEYRPCDELKKFIRCFWIIDREYNENSFLGNKEYLWPTGLTEILHIIGPNFFEIRDEKEYKLENEIIIGAYNKRFILKNNGKVRIIGIRCYNHGATVLFNVNLNNIKNKIDSYNLENIDRSILNSNDNENIIEYLNSYCKEYIKENRFIDIMYKFYNENLSLEDICTESNLSRRQLERKVKEFTTFTPKELMKIIRFDKARIEMLWGKDYMQVMSDLGYYDYSHFSKEFKKYYDITPKQFIDMYNKKFN